VILLTNYNAYDLRVAPFGDRDQYVNNFVERATWSIQSNPSYKSNVLINGVLKDLIIINTEFANEKVIHSFDREKCFNLGELVNYKNSHWLVTAEDLANEVYLTGRMKQCSHLLKWQNPETYEIIERWVVVENPYSSGIEEGKVITVGGNQYKIKLQYDEETKLLYLGKRFLIGSSNNIPIAYRLTRFDDISGTIEDNSRGFLTIIVDEDVLQDSGKQCKDNVDLMIANYIDSPILASVAEGTCDVKYDGGPAIKSGGNPKIFRAQFKDYNDNLIPTIVPSWDVIFPPDIENPSGIKILSQHENEIQILVDSDLDIGKSFILNVSADDNDYGYFESELKISIVPILSREG